jgi:hypothetical protein
VEDSSDNTKAVLNVAADEEVATLIVQATAAEDSEKSDAATVTVAPPGVSFVNNVTINPGDPAVSKGGSLQFTVSVTGSEGISQGVTWELTSEHAKGTAVTSTGGFLNVAADEGASTLTVKAASSTDPAKSGEVRVIVVEAGTEYVNSVTVDPQTGFVSKGGSLQFTASVAGSEGISQGVAWELTSEHAKGTTVTSTGGLLNVAADEGASTLTVKATSSVDAAKFGTVTVTVLNPQDQLPVPEGVTLSDHGVAKWTALTDETNVASYSIQIWKGGDSNTREGDRITVTKGTGKTENSYSYDLLSVLQGKTLAHYGISIKAIGVNGSADSNDTDNTAPAAWQEVKKQEQVPYVWWDGSNTTVAHWDTVSDARAATDYTINVYRGGTKVGETIGTATYEQDSKLKAYVDLASKIEERGPGSYTFGVVTKGNGYLILDSDEKKGDGQYVNVSKNLAAPANLKWDGTTAKWDAVTGATGYLVQLYKNGSSAGSAVSVTEGTASYANFDVSGAGVYTFTVIAKGDGTNSLDSTAADSSLPADNKGKLTNGNTAAITFTPANESGSLSVTPPGPVSISKTGTTNSVMLKVAGDGFTGFTWVVDGKPITETETGYTLSMDKTTLTITAVALKLGGHSVTVRTEKGGVFWSPAGPVTITVTR